MGKIMVVGKAEREYEANECSINLEIEVSRQTSSEASKVSSEQCEALLSKLQDELGINPSSIEIHYDRIDKRSSYKSNEISYESKKSFWLHIPADMKLVNAIRHIIETGFDDVSFTALYSVSNEAALNKELFKEAIADSRAKADFLAESMGLKITGIDSANLSGDEDVYDLTEEPVEIVRYKMSAAGASSLSDQLKPNQVELSAEVKIVWLVS